MVITSNQVINFRPSINNLLLDCFNFALYIVDFFANDVLFAGITFYNNGKFYLLVSQCGDFCINIVALVEHFVILLVNVNVQRALVVLFFLQTCQLFATIILLLACIVITVDIRVNFVMLKLVVQIDVLFSIGRLTLKFRQATLDFLNNNHQVVHIQTGSFQLTLSFNLFYTEGGNTHRFFENCTTILWLGIQDCIHTALSNNGVTFLTKTNTTQKFFDIHQTNDVSIQKVLTFVIAVKFTTYDNFVHWQWENASCVVHVEGHFAVAHRLARVSTVKDKVLHVLTTQVFCTLFTKYPADSIGNITFTATIWSNDTSNRLIKF